MKKLILLSFFACLMFATYNTFAQDPVPVPTDTTQVVVPDVQDVPADNQATATTIMTACAIAGALFRIIVQTAKGIKNPNNDSPTSFEFGYWIKDNLLPKIMVILTFILTLTAPFKLPDSTIGIVVLGIIALVVGYFIDLLSDWMQNLSPKVKS